MVQTPSPTPSGPPTMAAAREGSSTPSGLNGMSKGPYATKALLPSQLSPAGQMGKSQEVADLMQGPPPQPGDIRQTVQMVNDYMKLSDTHLEFVVTEGTGRIVIQVIDTESQKVVRQIPPETVLRFGQTMSQLRGLLFEGLV